MDVSFLTIGLGGSLGVLGGAVALGIRHGIDWDHIAAITDITSTTSARSETGDEWLTGEPGVLLTDESDHEVTKFLRRRPIASGEAIAIEVPVRAATPGRGVGSLLASQRRAILLGSLHAFGHGTVVLILSLLAILAAGFLPGWIDPIMERVVGLTPIFLATYLFYSLYRYLRGKGEFRTRSRWMLVFVGVRIATNWLWARLRGEKEHVHVHVHVHAADQYGSRTAYTVGLIHGIGAETGTQVLVIATAVGAGTKAMGMAALLAFVTGILISNSFVTVATAAGFISAQQRQLVYVLAGLLAAVFSLVVGVIFLLEAGSILPSLGTYFRWIGGPRS